MGRKIYYSIFRKKEIQALYNFIAENENNPHFAYLHDRIEHYIKQGFHNPLIINLAEKRFNAEQPIRKVRHFIIDVIEKGYSIEQAKALAIHSGFKKKIIKIAFKLNKKERKNERTKQISKPIREVESFEIPYEKHTIEPKFDEYPATPTRARIGEPRGVPRAEPRGAVHPAIAKVEPRTNTSYPARVSTNSQIAGQRDLQIGSVEKPRKKSRYFG